MYPDQLIMVKAERKISDGTYTEEFLFSEAGDLLFYFQKADNDKTVPSERRVYFVGVRPIRIIDDGKTSDRLAIKSTGAIKDIVAESVKLKDLVSQIH